MAGASNFADTVPESRRSAVQSGQAPKNGDTRTTTTTTTTHEWIHIHTCAGHTLDTHAGSRRSTRTERWTDFRPHAYAALARANPIPDCTGTTN
eukprot:3268967-Pyramimonas_sp.AAC.1